MKNIIEVIQDPNLFRPFLGDLSTWAGWLTALKVLYGMPVKDKTGKKLIRQRQVAT